MDTKFIFGAIILLILISIQYTLNLILREIKSLRINTMQRKHMDFDDYNRRDKSGK